VLRARRPLVAGTRRGSSVAVTGDRPGRPAWAPGENIHILEQLDIVGGSVDGARSPRVWRTAVAFQKSHSAVDLRRCFPRFIQERRATRLHIAGSAGTGTIDLGKNDLAFFTIGSITTDVTTAMMPEASALFSRRVAGDRPKVIPGGSQNVVFTVEYSIHGAMHAVHEFWGSTGRSRRSTGACGARRCG